MRSGGGGCRIRGECPPANRVAQCLAGYKKILSNLCFFALEEKRCQKQKGQNGKSVDKSKLI